MARIKWAVGKGNRLGVAVRQAETLADVRAWYRLYLETMRTHCLPPRPFRLFELMWHALRPRGLMRLLLAERERELIAGSIYLMSGNTVFYAFNGCRRSALALRPNDMIQWQAIHDSCQEGFRYYDMGEVSNGNGGLADFKAKWGTEERQLYRHYMPRLAGRDLDPESLDAAVSPRGLIAAAWRAMPLAATEVVGQQVYRFL